MVRSARITATGTLFAAGGFVRGLYWVATAGAGSIVLRDGGAGGAVVLTIDTPAAVGAHSLQIPGNGLEFKTDVHATLTAVGALTGFQQKNF